MNYRAAILKVETSVSSVTYRSEILLGHPVVFLSGVLFVDRETIISVSAYMHQS